MIQRIVNATVVLCGWWLFGLMLLASWVLTLGRYEVPRQVQEDLPAEPESAFAAGIGCFAVGVHAAARVMWP